MGTSYSSVDPFSLDGSEPVMPQNMKSNDYVKTKRMKSTVTTTTSVQNNKISEDLIPEMPSLDINIDQIIKNLSDILKSPSPLMLYKKSNELKENFSSFINYIAKKIAEGFNSQNKTVILTMYQNANYQQIWISNLKSYLEDSKYFDLKLYFKAVTVFDKEKQYLAKGLMKMYLRNSKEQIDQFLSKYKSKYRYEDIKGVFESLKMENIKMDVKYLNENRIECFLEQLSLDDGIDSEKILWLFWINPEEMKSRFDDTYAIFSEIARSYLKNLSYKDEQILNYINSDKNILIKQKIDIEIKKYFEEKEHFYKNIISLISDKNEIERGYFWSYVKTEIINRYYKEITKLFYWDKVACGNRNEWAMLRGNFILNDKNIFVNEINGILSFKKLIIEINKSMLSPFLKPIVYTIVSEKISINQKDLLKLRYLMTLILSENYDEYKKIYNFFEDLETFLDFNMSSDSLLNINFKKIKIFTADAIVACVFLGFLYFYAPVGVFVGTLLLMGSFARHQFWTFHSGIEWNFGTKTFATVLLVVSGFFWITNLDKTKVDLNGLTQKVEKLGVYKTQETAKIAASKLGDLKIGEMVADILQSKKKNPGNSK
ncbi:MAG: hypothetical protein PHS92_05255 [Candidatus Gracilibacteria bacterium]|nr:hypothetical protein [Candidatus Gracilibacteria bacterium]